MFSGKKKYPDFKKNKKIKGRKKKEEDNLLQQKLMLR